MLFCFYYCCLFCFDLLNRRTLLFSQKLENYSLSHIKKTKWKLFREEYIIIYQKLCYISSKILLFSSFVLLNMSNYILLFIISLEIVWDMPEKIFIYEYYSVYALEGSVNIYRKKQLKCEWGLNHRQLLKMNTNTFHHKEFLS